MSNLKFSQKFGNSQIYERFPPGKDARKIFDEKGVSAPQKLTDFFKKNRIKKQ